MKQGKNDKLHMYNTVICQKIAEKHKFATIAHFTTNITHVAQIHA